MINDQTPLEKPSEWTVDLKKWKKKFGATKVEISGSEKNHFEKTALLVQCVRFRWRVSMHS